MYMFEKLLIFLNIFSAVWEILLSVFERGTVQIPTQKNIEILSAKQHLKNQIYRTVKQYLD